MLISCKFYVNLCQNHTKKLKIIFLIYMIILCQKKFFTDGQTDGHPKTIVRNLTKIGLTLIGINVLCEVPFYK